METIYLFNFSEILLSLLVSLCEICVLVLGEGELPRVPWHMCGGQRTTLWSWFRPSTSM